MENILYRIGEAIFMELEEISGISYLPEEHEIQLYFKNEEKMSIYLVFKQ